MSLHPLLDRIALAANLCTAADTPMLQAVREQLGELCAALERGSEAAEAEAARAALACVERILAGASADRDADFQAFVERVHALADGAGARARASETPDAELVAAFASGAEETLARLEALVVELEALDDPRDHLARIAALVHTLKGECGVIPLAGAERVLHEAESWVDRRRADPARTRTEPVLAAFDWVAALVRRLAADPRAEMPSESAVLDALRGASEPIAAATDTSSGARVAFPAEALADPALPEFVAEARGHLENAEAALLALEAEPSSADTIDRIFRTFHTVKGVASFLQLDAMAELAHAAEALLDRFRKGESACAPEHSALLFEACDVMGSLVKHLAGGEAPLVATVAAARERLALAASGAAPSTPRAVPSGPAPIARRGAPKAPDPPRADELVPAPGAPGQRLAALEGTVKVATRRLDALVDMVGELLIAQQAIQQDLAVAALASPKLDRTLAQVAKITRNLQETAMSLRMVTLRSTFQRMARLARDVAQKSRKAVVFTTEGEDTELDRNLVEAIGDPLVHLIRNAIDHGIEPPEERVRARKSEIGRVELRAYHRGGSIHLEIRDDGRGLAREKILARAIERKLLPEGTDPAALGDAEVHRMIFLPGFTTADEVTSLSGRGVGMDVVRRSVEAMRGRIDIESSPSAGSCFTLRLPLTLAIIDGMVVRCGEQRYVVPTLAVERSFRPTRAQLHPVLGRGATAEVRGSLLPVHRLVDLLGERDAACGAGGGILIVVEAAGRRVCIAVDELLAQQQVVIKSMGKGLPPLPGIGGAAILGDGRVALILDVDTLLARAEHEAAAAACGGTGR